MLQALTLLCGSALDSLVVVSPALQVYLTKAEQSGRLTTPWPAGNPLPNEAQEAGGLPCHKDTLLAHGQLAETSILPQKTSRTSNSNYIYSCVQSRLSFTDCDSEKNKIH